MTKTQSNCSWNQEIDLLFMIFDVFCWLAVYLSHDQGSKQLNILILETNDQNSSMVKMQRDQ